MAVFPQTCSSGVGAVQVGRTRQSDLSDSWNVTLMLRGRLCGLMIHGTFVATYVSRAFLKRLVAETRRKDSSDWWTPSIARSHGYRPPKTLGFRPELHKVRKELASRYYQRMTGHAVIAPYLKYKIKKSDSDECWWCEIGKRQTREHLFKECLHWKVEITELWRRVSKDVGWRNHRWKPISSLFNEKKATGAILEFLDKTEWAR